MNKVQLALKSVKTSCSEVLAIQISMGCVICHSPDCRFDDLYKASDDALYEAKNNGKDRYVVREI